MKENEREDFELPPILKEMKGENPFGVPHNYFKGLPDEVLDQIRQEKQPHASNSWITNLSKSLIAIFQPRAILAFASIGIVIAGMFWWAQSSSSSDTLFAAEDFDQQELATYILDHLDEFNESDFYTNEAASLDPMEETFDEQDLDPLLDELIDDFDTESLEDLL